MKIIAPLYRYPTLPGWDRVIAIKPSAVVINPDSGPGIARKPDYTALVSKLVANGIRCLGYIATGYAREIDMEPQGKQIWRVNEERERYARFYPEIGGQLGGYFYDESASEPERVFYYRQLVRGGFGGVEAMVLNQGTFPDHAYTRMPIINTSYETSFERYIAKAPPSWSLMQSNWYHIVYSVETSAQMRQVVALAKARSAGYVWCCQDPAEYDLVPDYLEEMAALVKAQ